MTPLFTAGRLFWRAVEKAFTAVFAAMINAFAFIARDGRVEYAVRKAVRRFRVSSGCNGVRATG